jgi:hypothetical protein
MPDTIPADAIETALSDQIPARAQTISLRVRVKPKGAVLVYPTSDTLTPIRCPAPTKHIVIGNTGPKIYVQRVDGATEFQVDVVGWE